ncbi:hypothetical protein ACM64Y_02525 [Novispirillum sp. DQ9]|uniref:hypothetical protein n=1 Tax=Novispirillum sp. DQ9 TaxID=3398612 RepID=UPI003C7E6C8A
MIRSIVLGAALSVAVTCAALAADTIAGKYTYTGVYPDGGRYGDNGTLLITSEPSGAYSVKWDSGEYVGIGQLVGRTLAVSTTYEKRPAIMLMDIEPNGDLSGRWWRRNDPGTKGRETWKRSK